jgi:hypothetical protein
MASDTSRAQLEDVMLAMDVVDTLRHRRGLIERELSAGDRRARLIDQLRETYHSQGIEVSDDVLEQGVAALEENRFAYTPPKPSIRVALARAYVKRSRWLMGVITIAILVAVAFAVTKLLMLPFSS